MTLVNSAALALLCGATGALAGTTTYSYDALGRLVATTPPQANVNYSYDPAGNRAMQQVCTTASTTPQTLTPGQSLTSANGQYSLNMQSADGNLVVYGPSGATWSANTSGHPGASAAMQPNGTLEVIASQGNILWVSDNYIGPGAQLVMQNDGNLVIVDACGTTRWASTNGSITYNYKLLPGQYLLPGDQLVSTDGRFNLQYQPDGNLVLYGPGSAMLWSSKTAGQPPSNVTLQSSDGNLVMHSTAGAVWSTNTFGNPGDFLQLQTDGNLVIYASSGAPIWASNTSGNHATPTAPIANNVTASVGYNSRLNSISPILSGDTAASLATASAPTNGVVYMDGRNFIYTPNTNYSGADQFTYTATNATATSAPATVSITVGGIKTPVANTVSAAAVNTGASASTTGSGTTIAPVLTGGTATGLTIFSQPNHGTATTNGLNLVYTPAAGFYGDDVFLYSATNSSGTSTPASVDVKVSWPPIPATPPITVAYGSTGNVITPTYTGGPFTSLTLGTQGLGPVAAEGTYFYYSAAGISPGAYGQTDSFTYTATGPGGTSQLSTVNITVNPQQPVAGPVSANIAYNASSTPITLSLSGGPIYGLTASNPANGASSVSGNSVSYQPNANYYGSDSFSYTITNAAGSSTATISLTVAAPAAPTVNNVTASAAFNSPVTIPLQISGANISSVAFANFATGTQSVETTGSGTSTSAVFTPTTNFAGSTTFTYTATNAGGPSGSAIVTVNVAYPPLPTVSPVSSFTVAKNSDSNTVPITNPTTNTGITAVSVTAPPSNGKTYVNGLAITYTPNANFTGSDIFYYTETNAKGSATPAKVTITVQSGNGNL